MKRLPTNWLVLFINYEYFHFAAQNHEKQAPAYFQAKSDATVKIIQGSGPCLPCSAADDGWDNAEVVLSWLLLLLVEQIAKFIMRKIKSRQENQNLAEDEQPLAEDITFDFNVTV